MTDTHDASDVASTPQEQHTATLPRAASITNGAQALVAFDERGRIRLAFDDDDAAYDLSALQPSHDPQPADVATENPAHSDAAACGNDHDHVEVPPRMNVCIMIVGTRGDVQPFIGIGKRLQQDGHRVRLATHAVYRDFVTEHGLEFYPLGGDPKELAAYMVKTGGHLIPLKYETLTKDVPRNMQMIDEILHSTWPAVSAPDPDGLGTGIPGRPFRAHAIISNPVTYGHIHVAERLGVPLHIMFPQPWVPTVAFPHPLANMPYDNGPQTRNFLSYKLVDLLMWQGTRGIVNRFRTDVLGLRKLRMGDHGRDLLLDLAIPHAFMWSPALVPKPADWGPRYDVIGTVLLKEAGSNYTPTPALEAFLSGGSDGHGPIFVGFGSMVIADPKATTTMIIEAAQRANARVLIQSSWSDMAAGIDVPDNVFFLGNCPHDWLMPRVAAVVHHGGAGTTAAGLLAGKPTFIVPFFGDQPFWGHAVVRAGVGVAPCPIAQLSVEILRNAFVQLQAPELRARALALRDVMAQEDGADQAVQCFYRHLPLAVMRCDVCSQQLATKWSERDAIRLCAACEHVITARPENAAKHIRDYQPVDYRAHGPENLLEGVSTGTMALVDEVASGYKQLVVKPAEGFRRDGAVGALVGLTTGLAASLVLRPLFGLVVCADHIATGHHNTFRRKDERKVGTIWLENKRLRHLAGDKHTAPVGHTATMKPTEHIHKKKAPEGATVAAFLDSLEARQRMTVRLRELLAQRQASRAGTATAIGAGSAVPTTTTVRPTMTISVLAIGSSIAPFVAIARQLRADGHRVRVASHACFRAHVERAGLEFFALGGDATTIDQYVTYQLAQPPPGLFGGAVSKRKFAAYDALQALVFSLWPACVQDEPGNCFRADLIVAHRLAFGHTVVAERLGVPLHCIATAPLVPSASASSHAVDALLQRGVRKILTSFRSFVGLSGAPSRRNALDAWRVPHSYLWSPALTPKPACGTEICLAGFVDTKDEGDDQESNAKALAALRTFVAAAETPIVYVGVQRHAWPPARETQLLEEFEAAAATGSVRILYQLLDEVNTTTNPLSQYESPTVLQVPVNLTIETLAPFVAGAVHAGDGTSVASWLRAGVPSSILASNALHRLYGDALASAGVGPAPLTVETVSATTLATLFQTLLNPTVRETTHRIRDALLSEPSAIETVVQHVYTHLPLDAMQCDLDPTRVARLFDAEHELKLSYEAELVVQAWFHDDREVPSLLTKYKPLTYRTNKPPKPSLRRVDPTKSKKKKNKASPCTVVYEGKRHYEPSSSRRPFSLLNLGRTKSFQVNVVEADWTTPEVWRTQVADITTAYETLRSERTDKQGKKRK